MNVVYQSDKCIDVHKCFVHLNVNVAWTSFSFGKVKSGKWYGGMQNVVKYLSIIITFA